MIKIFKYPTDIQIIHLGHNTTIKINTIKQVIGTIIQDIVIVVIVVVVLLVVE